jgi:hypothetical protein
MFARGYATPYIRVWHNLVATIREEETYVTYGDQRVVRKDHHQFHCPSVASADS